MAEKEAKRFDELGFAFWVLLFFWLFIGLYAYKVQSHELMALNANVLGTATIGLGLFLVIRWVRSWASSPAEGGQIGSTQGEGETMNRKEDSLLGIKRQRQPVLTIAITIGALLILFPPCNRVQGYQTAFDGWHPLWTLGTPVADSEGFLTYRRRLAVPGLLSELIIVGLFGLIGSAVRLPIERFVDVRADRPGEG